MESKSNLLLDQNFFTLSAGYMAGFDQPYYSAKIGSEVGDCGNIYLQVLAVLDDEYYFGGYQGVDEDLRMFTFGGGYTHYFPMSDDGAFFIGASMGVANTAYDASYLGVEQYSLEGNSFYTDGNVGYEHFLTDYLIFNVTGKLLYAADFSDGGGVDELGAYQWKFEHKDIYYGVEAGLTFIF